MAIGSGTTARGLHYLAPSDPPDLAGATQQLASDVDADLTKNIWRRVVAPGYLTAAFSAGTGGAAAGSLAIPSLAVGGTLTIGLQLTPPNSTAVTTLITWTGDSRLTLLTSLRTYATFASSTGNLQDAQYAIPLTAGANGTVSFTVTPAANGCTARMYAWVDGS